VIQIAWGLHTGAAGKFPRIEVTGIPFVVEGSEVSSVALYRLYKSGVLDAEYDEAVPLMFVGFPPNQLHMRAPLKTLEDLNGLKVLAGTKSASEIVAALGGAPVSLSITENYQALQRGTADGTLLVWTAFQPFKLAEVTKYHLEVPLGSGTGHVMMAKKKYVALPEAVRRLIDANATEKETRVFGAFWDVVQGEGREMARSAGHTIVDLPAAQTEAWKRKLVGIEADWVKRTPDGANVLARYRALVAQVKAGS
jgi:TRAP-type C4-dicarboxylate transport system substrate-binding protein